MRRHFIEKGTLEGYPGVEETNITDPYEFMQKPCDVLLPAAVETVINKNNAPKL